MIWLCLFLWPHFAPVLVVTMCGHIGFLSVMETSLILISRLVHAILSAWTLFAISVHGWCLEKTPVFSFTLTLTALVTPDLWAFSHTDQLSDVRWVHCNSIHFFLTLSAWSECRLHRLRAQSHKIISTSDASQKSRLAHVLLTGSKSGFLWVVPRVW